MTTHGVIREWSDDDGWGVIDSDATPGGCWVHYSDLRIAAGFKTFAAGAPVEFTFEEADQDGFAFRAEGAWPEGEEPVDNVVRGYGPSGAFQSVLSISFDEPDDDG